MGRRYHEATLLRSSKGQAQPSIAASVTLSVRSMKPHAVLTSLYMLYMTWQTDVLCLCLRHFGKLCCRPVGLLSDDSDGSVIRVLEANTARPQQSWQRAFNEKSNGFDHTMSAGMRVDSAYM